MKNGPFRRIFLLLTEQIHALTEQINTFIIKEAEIVLHRSRRQRTDVLLLSKEEKVMKKLLAAALAGVMAVSLAACGGSASNSAAPAAESAAEAAESAAEETGEEAAPAAEAGSGDYSGHKLVVANWQDYSSDCDYAEKAFEDKFGCEV